MPASAAAEQGRLPMGSGDEAVTTTDVEQGLAQQSDLPSQGVNMDAELGVGPSEEDQSGPVVGLAQEEGQNIAEGETDQPVVDGIGSDTPVQANRSIIQRPAAQAELNQSPIRRQQPNTQVAMLPRVDNPMPRIEQQEEAPQSTPGVMPASEIACRQELQRMGVVYNDKPAISSGPACQVRLSGFVEWAFRQHRRQAGSNVELSGDACLCQMGEERIGAGGPHALLDGYRHHRAARRLFLPPDEQ